MGRIAVIGDLAGHRAELEAELRRLGMQDGELPDDLTVVQVGDLVHRGPDSAGAVALVDRLLAQGRWVQLAGNHEAQYLAPPVFDWPERLDDDTVATLRRWWAEGAMRPAAAVAGSDGEPWLITHAGLTGGYWAEALGAPDDAVLAARALNSFAGTHDAVLFAPGQMLGGGPPNPAAGPLWAAAASELVPSWDSAEPPFSQVHGHSMIADWRRRELRCDPSIAARVHVDEDAKHETVTMGRRRIVGVDPGHGRRPVRPWRAFVIDGAVVD